MKTRLYFKCLNGNDVVTAKISDHHPVVHDGILFWNVMMQGKLRNGRTGVSYNNGLGIIETDKQYRNRLFKVANVISEVIHFYPAIEVINLCEGPIQVEHVNVLLQSLKQNDSMDKFFLNSVIEDVFHQPNINGFPHWGLLMLANKKYKVKDVAHNFITYENIYNKLANRFHVWELTQDNEKNRYIALGHFPFSGDEQITEKHNLSLESNRYCQLVRDIIEYYSDKLFVLCADFNLNPYLISEWEDRILDLIPSNNSILFTVEEKLKNKIDEVTVDGVLLSRFEKQRYGSKLSHLSLFARLKGEDSLRELNKQYLIENRHQHAYLQRRYDEQFGLVLR